MYPSCQDTTELADYVRNSLSILASQGWLSIPLPPDLESLYANLFAESASFFNLPPDAREKLDFAAPTGTNASDEGFSEIQGEKQLITLRRLSRTPPCLRSAATAAWDATGQLFLRTVHAIAESLELPDQSVFDAMSAEAQGLPASARASSLLRLFRYNRPPGGAGARKKVVAEAHKDLGLLTLVVGQSPGLDARDAQGRWVSVEDTPRGPGAPRLTATLLAGQTLTYLTRELYASGAHRVSVLPSAPSPSDPHDAFRHSLVFALRPAPAAPISTAAFEASPLIGAFPTARLSAEANNFPECSMYAQPAGELFRAISQRHWNVNIAPEMRAEQKKRLAEKVGVKPEDMITVDGVAMAVGVQPEAREAETGEARLG
ncbi:hypothetical protein DFH08DRAFT_680337 [Mycena albidolilacea]|uniref:Uncharacterized protein n=1 Tax=Mycena albidolilacea TaxID=1033008 RepID=A0AAD7AQT2_9AGAR|nr:hypothetical protein DFH08DRAFT_680337 [Mycena albidolilacea]